MPRDYIYDQGFSEARLVLEHLTEPRRIRFGQVAEAIITFMQQAGFEPRYGRRVVADLAQPGGPTFTASAAP